MPSGSRSPGSRPLWAMKRLPVTMSELAVAIQVGQHQGMRLRPAIVDHVLDPGALRGLLHPEDAVVVGQRSDQVGTAVAIDVHHVNEAGLAELEIGVKSTCQSGASNHPVGTIMSVRPSLLTSPAPMPWP